MYISGGKRYDNRMTLADRMKRYEHTYRQYLPRRTYTLLRLDGRAFHSYTRGLHRPFDPSLLAAMNATAQALCKEITGTRFAYVQSDEISLLVTDFQSESTEPWMAGNVAKVLSLSAACATAEFNTHRVAQGLALFDSRVWTMSDPVEVMNYFIWRQRDCVKNSITMTASAYCSHKELEGLNSDQRQELVFQKHGVNWNNIDVGLKQGRVVFKTSFQGANDSIRSMWMVTPAPKFMVHPSNWLAEMVPLLPGVQMDSTTV